MYQHKTDVIRENIFELLIVILIFIELVIGIIALQLKHNIRFH